MILLALQGCPEPPEQNEPPPLIVDTSPEDSPTDSTADSPIDSPIDSPVDTEPPCEPISLTEVPEFCSHDDLGGTTCGLDGSFTVAPYIYMEAAGGWWTKPTSGAPTVPIEDDGTWTADITTGGIDSSATRICAYLVPDGESPPLALGEADLDPKLDAWEHACVDRPAPDNTLEWADRTWQIKGQCGASYGPGPCVFREDFATVADGKLTLHAEGTPTCSEVYLQEPLGFGQYSFTVETPLDDLGDDNAVLGLFTWDDDSAHNHREIDFEFAVWGTEGAENAQFVVQPYTTDGNRHRFYTDDTAPSTHTFQWTESGVVFSSGEECLDYAGGDTPPEGDERVHLNLWLLGGEAKDTAWSKDVVLTDFSFTEDFEPITCP